MSFTLEQYAQWLDGRDLPWPCPPPVEKPRAKPATEHMEEIRAVTWNIYGTLLCMPPAGELLFEHPNDFIMKMALEKTIAEFKMWGSMSRKSGQPSEYMGHIYKTLLQEQAMRPGGPEKHPEIHAEKIWENVVKKLLQKDYQFDSVFYGSLNEFSRKIAYFFHASLQGTCCYPTADRALRYVASSGLAQGLIADGQCFTMLQLQRGLDKIGDHFRLDDVISPDLRFLSCDVHGKPPSERLFHKALEKFGEKGIEPNEILHVGNRIEKDIVPAKKLGMKTALFAGDKTSLGATPSQLKDPATRPDLLLTELEQILEVVGH